MSTETPPPTAAPRQNVWIGSIDPCDYMGLAADAVDGRGNIVLILQQGLKAMREYRERVGKLLGAPLPAVRTPGNSGDRIVLLTAGITRMCTDRLLPSMLHADAYQPQELGVAGALHGITSSFDYFFPNAEREVAEALERGRTIRDDTRQLVSLLLPYFTISSLCAGKPVEDLLRLLQRTLSLVNIHDCAAAEAIAQECNRSLASLSGECTDRQLSRIITPQLSSIPELRGTMMP